MSQDIVKQFENFIYKKQWTQTEAAEKVGCSQEHLSRIFRGLRNPSAKLLDKFEEVMNEYGKE